MPLLIENKTVPGSNNLHPSIILSQFASLRDFSKKFLQDALSVKKEICGKQSRLLYVCQREYAAVSSYCNKSNLQYIGSDDATTCHIVILIEPKMKITSVGHFDGSYTAEGLQSMILEISTINKLLSSNSEVGNLELYILGGFIDKKKYSEKIFSGILFACTQVKESIELRLACTYSVNNNYHNGKNHPLFLGTVVDINTLEIIIVTKITHRGPDLMLREVRLLYGNMDGMFNIYDSKEGCVYTSPFTFEPIWVADKLLSLPDEHYLEVCSTSPHCEPEDFVEKSKSAIRFTLKYKDKIDTIFCGGKRKCCLNENLEWVYLSGHSILDLG